MGGGFRRPLSSAARRRQDTKPQPPSWGGGGPQPAGGAPFLCRPGQALSRAAGIIPPPFSAPGRRRKPGLAAARGQPKENHGRAPDRGPPPPRRPGDGGAPPGGGRIRRRRGTDAGQAANPTPRRPQPATGPPPHGRAPRRGGCGPPHPGGQQRDRTQADHGPGAPPPATSQHQRRRGPTGRGRTRPGRCDLAAYLLCLPQRGKQRRRGESPEPGRRGGGPCARRPGGTGGGRYGQKQGPSLPVVGRRRRQKKCREACPPAGHDWTKKNAGRTLCPPPLAVTADTRYPPVRRSSPKRTRCRPVPYALAVRLSLGLRSCVP